MFVSAFFLVTLIGLFVTRPRGPIWNYCFRVWVSLDQFLNAAFFLGNEDHTISGHAGRKRREGSRGWAIFANVIDWVALHGFDDKNHCNNAIEEDEKGRDYQLDDFGVLQLILYVGFSTLVVGILLDAMFNGVAQRMTGMMG